MGWCDEPSGEQVMIGIGGLVVLIIFGLFKFIQGIAIGLSETRGGVPYRFGTHWHRQEREQLRANAKRD
jgi:hypothetical protein